jgi:hypothetical protein
VCGGGDGDDEGADEAAFQGSGSSHHLATVESESNNRLGRDSQLDKGLTVSYTMHAAFKYK